MRVPFLFATAVSCAAPLLSASLSWADFQARVLIVHEGDRMTISHNGHRSTVFLKDIDCPDPKQPYGKQAKQATAAYVGGRDVLVRGLTTSADGRATAEVLLPDGRNVSSELVKEGLAWVRRTKGKEHSLEDMEEFARAEGKGLWSEPNPVPPWKWKASKKVSRKFSN